jgi:hypothetical protein
VVPVRRTGLFHIKALSVLILMLVSTAITVVSAPPASAVDCSDKMTYTNSSPWTHPTKTGDTSRLRLTVTTTNHGTQVATWSVAGAVRLNSFTFKDNNGDGGSEVQQSGTIESYQNDTPTHFTSIVMCATATKYSIPVVMSPSVMPVGSTAWLRGAVYPSAPGKTVIAQRYYSGAWHNVASQALSSSSTYSFPQKPARGIYTFRVYKAGAGSVAAATSSAVTLHVGVYRVTGSLSPTSMVRGSTAHFKGAVAPARGGQKVVLQRYYSSAWHGVTTYTLSSNSTYDFAIRLTSPGTYTYRVVKSGDGTYSAGYSPNRVIKVT